MTDELLKALQTIEEECKNNDNCASCPLYSCENSDCGVTSNTPSTWELEKREVYFK